MRLSEQTDEQLIKQIEDDALAREIFNRLVISKMRVSDEVQALENRVGKALADRDVALHRVGQLEAQVADQEREIAVHKDEVGACKRQLKQCALAAPRGTIAIHNSVIERDLSKVSLQWHTEERQGCEGWFLCIEAQDPNAALEQDDD